ncbi:MAG: MOSC domain-containing protein [Acidobacteria bacterium]|nr:MOSC domain-containing protein [Acidobacteriota bacterium]
MTVRNLTLEELEAGLDEIRESPRDHGVLAMIVRRPAVGAREVVEQGELDVASGLVGDTWGSRGRSPHPDTQLTVMNSRVIGLLAHDEHRWRLAGDQLLVDLDLSAENVPPGTRLALGTAVIEVTGMPHTGCGKFASRFGVDAVTFVNSPMGRGLRLRGINAKVVQACIVRVGDVVRKVQGG